MGSRKKLSAAFLTVALLVAFPSATLAGEDDAGDGAVRDVPVTDEAPSPAPVDVVTDKPSDSAKDAVSDRPSDRVTDRVTDICRKHSHGDLRPHCVDDRHPHDFNVRKLILRLIHAGEWEKLIRLLHWLGWI